MMASPGSNLGPYNAAADLIERNLARWPDRIAFIDNDRPVSFRVLARQVNEAGCILLQQGLRPGDRLALCLEDGAALVAAFLGAIRVGVLPMPLNTLLAAGDYTHVLSDSAAAAALVSPALAPAWSEAAAQAGWSGQLWIGSLPATHGGAPPAAASTGPADPAFLLYSSGSTGRPKGVLHAHASLAHTAESFAAGVLGLRADDVIYSAAKLFFAYGLGNSLTFPLWTGATAILQPERVTPAVVWRALAEHGATVFCGVPTLFAALLASPDFPAPGALNLRLCVSAGEPLPAEISRTWTARTGVEIVDGIGSTEMLHIFLCNRPGQIRHGVTGVPAPGYEVRVVAADGAVAAAGRLGELHVRGPSAALGYWRNPEQTRAVFADGWVRTGDQFRRLRSGHYVYAGRSDDMLKVSGIWVSPAEVEGVLLEHEAVREAAVVGVRDAHGLIKTRAYVVAAQGFAPGAELAQALKAFSKSRLALHKYPRQICFVDELPKTATGKIRRHLLRALAATNIAS